MRSFLTVIGLIVAVFLVINNGFAQLIIEGQVVSGEDQEPMVGAHVFPLSNWRLGTTTDLQGYFKLNMPLKEQPDSLIITYVGFRERTISISDLLNNETIELTFLESTMNVVEVRAAPLIAEEFSIKKITRLDIYKNPSAKADALLSVNSMPSSTTLDESANVSFRGSGPAETGIFLNGVPVYDPVRFSQLNGIGTFSLFNTEMLKEVQVFPGNPPLEFGNTTSGLISIHTEDRIPVKPVHSISMTLASLGFNSRIPLSKNQSLIVYSNYQPSSVFKWLNPKSLERIKKFNSIDAGVHFIKKFDNEISIKVFNYTLRESYEYKFEDPTFDGIFYQEKVKSMTIGNLILPINNSSLSINSGYTHTDMDFAYSKSDMELKNDDLFLGLNYQLERKKAGVKFGTAYDRQKSNFNGIVPEYWYAIGPEYPTMRQQAKMSRTTLDSYGYLKYYFKANLILGAGARKNIPINNQKSYLSRQINLSYTLKERHVVKLAHGRFFKYHLTQGDETNKLFFNSLQSSIDIQSEYKRFELNLSFFQKNIKNSQNESVINGIELLLAPNIFDRFKSHISYTLLDAKISDGEITYPGSYDLNYFVKGALEWSLNNNWSISSRFLFRQGANYPHLIDAIASPDIQAYIPQYSLQNMRRYQAYNMIDVSISKLIPLNEKLTIIGFTSISNALDFQNTRGYIYNSNYSEHQAETFSRRMIYFGAVFNFFPE